jgi:hypothetical protein
MSKVDVAELSEKIIKGLELSFDKMLIQKQKQNEELVFERNGKIVLVKAEDLIKERNLKKK